MALPTAQTEVREAVAIASLRAAASFAEIREDPVN